MNAELLGAAVVDDLAAIWGDPDISAAIICAETDRHEALVLAGAAAGKHLFVEKPLGYGRDDAAKMAAAIDEAGVLFQTGYFMRGEPIHQFLREQIRLGHFGQITRLRHSNCHGGSLGDWFTPRWLWMTDPKVAGVGAYGDLGTHSLDIVLWLLGHEVERVTAVTGTALARYGAECDEFGEGMLYYKDGTVVTIAAGWVDIANPVRLLISGTEGHAHVIDDKLYFKSKHVEGADGQTPWQNLPAAWPHAFELFLDAVIDAPPPAGQKTIPLVTAQEAAFRSTVMSALYEAAAHKSWITL
jgi:predicted dehydrogenase